VAAAVRTDSAVLLALASLLPRAQLAAALLPSTSTVWAEEAILMVVVVVV
jgi:hypothetical protein